MINHRFIYAWMKKNYHRFEDACGDINLTEMVEIWDLECSTGHSTLKSDHPAWSIALQVAEEVA